MFCGPSPSPNLGLPGMLQGSEPDPRSLGAHLGRMPLCLWALG